MGENTKALELWPTLMMVHGYLNLAAEFLIEEKFSLGSS